MDEQAGTPAYHDIRPSPAQVYTPGTTTRLALVLTKEPAPAWRVVALLALLAIVVAIYWASLHNDFVWDDWDHLFDIDGWGRRVVNPDIKSLRGAVGSVKDLKSGADEPSRQVFRPVRTFSFALDYIFARGLSAKRLHTTNLLLHVLTVLTAYLAIRRLTGGFFVSIAGAGFFALHPVHTEAVDYISNRADLLAAPVLFLAVAAYASWRERTLGWAPALALYALAVLCKETAVVFPLALLLYDWAMPPEGKTSKQHLRSRAVAYAAFAVVCVTYLAARRAAMGPMATAEPWGRSMGATALMMVQALARYARLALFPLQLSARHEIPEVKSLLAPEFIGGALVVTAATLAVIWAFRKAPFVLFAIGWVFIFLAPVSNAIPVPGAMVAEHWLYLPAFGLAAIFGWALGGVVRRVYRSGSTLLFLIAAAAMLAVLAFFGARTVLRHDVWLNDETLFSSILEEDPNRTEARLNLGRFYWLDGQFEKAEREYRYVADLDKNHAEARFRLGTIASARSDLAEAIAWLEEALRLDPEHLHAHFELARSLDVSARSLADEVVKLRGAGLAEMADAAAATAAEFKRRAAEHYRRFLSLVESTGADVPLGKTSRARNRLHALEGAGGAEGGSDAGAGGGGAGGGG